MNRKLTALVATASLAVAIGGCQKQAPQAADSAAGTKISQSDAATAADATQAAWASQDAAKIDALYAPDIVGFDPAEAPLSTDRTRWTKLQQDFAGMKFDHADVSDRKIQVLDSDDFIVSGTAALTSKEGPMKTAAMRFTDVYRKQPGGQFLIVNEHVSMVPVPAPKAS
jgi:ketosteroid isomerase-like protein